MVWWRSGRSNSSPTLLTPHTPETGTSKNDPQGLRKLHSYLPASGHVGCAWEIRGFLSESLKLINLKM